MAQLNPKQSVPRVPGGKTFSFSRGHILSEDPAQQQRCYYGPGQPADSGPCQGISSDYSAMEIKDYAPPGDWPAAGTLLRMPQVVWLSSVPNKDTQNIYHASGTLHPYGGAGGSCPYEIFYSIQAVSATRYSGISGILSEVQGILENLRGGRTWIEIPNWGFHPSDPDPNSPATSDNQPNNFMGNTYPIMRAPSQLPLPGENTALDWFGTDFLHCYFGYLKYDSFQPEPLSLLRLQYDGTNAPITSDAYVNSALNLRRGIPRFRRYSARAWSTANLPVPTFRIGNNTVLNNPYYPHYSGSCSRPGGGFDPPGTWDDLAISTSSAALSDLLNTPGSSLDSDRIHGTSMANLVDDLAGQGYDFQVAGDLGTLTADSLVQVIADHFHFDPSTGKDLP